MNDFVPYDEDKPGELPHYYTIEELYHFNCGQCSKWWSIGDTFMINGVEPATSPLTNGKERRISCPHCGHKSRIKDRFLEEDDNKHESKLHSS